VSNSCFETELRMSSAIMLSRLRASAARRMSSPRVAKLLEYICISWTMMAIAKTDNAKASSSSSKVKPAVRAAVRLRVHPALRRVERTSCL
jgi:hypothetical protein